MKQIKKRKNKYRSKYVAFIDIMGFKDKIDKSKSDINMYYQIQSALNEFLLEKKLSTKLPLRGENITTFSDSIVISVPSDSKDNLLYLGVLITHLQVNLFDYGILIRGGITKGDIYHTKNVIFGPAFIEAYELESKYAIYPRIVLNKELYDDIIRSYRGYHGADSDKEIFKSFFALDKFTNLCYVDTLHCMKEIEYDNYIFYMKKVKSFIISNLSKEMPKNVKLKYIWLANYYNNTINRYSGLIDTNEFLINKSLIRF